MKELTLPPLIDEPKILGDYEHTWTVENWRSLSKREHGPIFHAGGHPWFVRTRLLTGERHTDWLAATGAFSSSRTATTLISLQFTWNMASSRTRSLRIGVAAFNLRWSCGIPTILASMYTTQPIIVSLRRKVIGVSPDLSSIGACSTCPGKVEAAADPLWRTILPTLQHTFDWSRMRLVSSGTTSPTTIQRRRLAM